MTVIKRAAFLATLAVGCALSLVQVGGARAAERSLTKKEIVDLYEGKSWFWEKGIAFFAAKGQFNAFSDEGGDRSTVAGDWEALDDGRMCFSGVWTAKSWRRFARTCFTHKIKDGQIYQRRMPKGEWYIFRHEPSQEGDQKLVPGDQTG
jgi:UDPglucose 6-dehydrogenase